MKKISVLFLSLVLCLVNGCSSGKEGVYKFDSLVVVEDGVERVYTCKVDEEAPIIVKSTCAGLNNGKQEIELKDSKMYLYLIDKEGNKLENEGVLERICC